MDLCFVDTSNKQTFDITIKGDPVYIVSNANLRPRDETVLVIPPVETENTYCLELRGDPPSLLLLHGECSIDGQPLASPCVLKHGAFIILGSNRSLQYVVPESTKPIVRRMLPPTPGKTVESSPPSKPPRNKPTHQQSASFLSATASETSSIRQQLQRIAAEVTARHSGYEGRKPPPPYEQVGNSIAYQVFHQQLHKSVTSELIDSLYPALKEDELKDSSLLETYSSYLHAYKQSLEQPASPECMLPADLPTLDFIVDLLLHLCCMPHMTAVAEKQGTLWCHLLALFSQSRQNQLYMASKRYPTRVLSCMHLNIMAPQLNFQQYGWTVLANTLDTPPTPTDGKPILSESSLTLALSLTEVQLAEHSTDVPLVTAIVNFLAQVATVAKTATINRKKELSPYTNEQGVRILALFREMSVLRHVMKVPPHLRKDQLFEQAYSTLVKALVPTRGRSGAAVKRVNQPSSSTSSPQDNVMSAQLDNIQLSQEEEHEFISNPKDKMEDIISKSEVFPSDRKYIPEPLRSFSCSNLLDHNRVSLGSTPLGSHSEMEQMGSAPNLTITQSLDSNELPSSSTLKSPEDNHPPDESLKHDIPEHRDKEISSSLQPASKCEEESTVETPDSTGVCPSTDVSPSLDENHSVLQVDEGPPGIGQSPPSRDALSPPMTPNTALIAQDVQSLLDSLHVHDNPLQQQSRDSVRVPSISRYSRYYKHSFKRTSTKQKDASTKNGRKEEQLMTGNARLQWGEVELGPSMIGRRNSALFEVSGKFLSSQHLVVEEITCGNMDIQQTLLNRIELVEGVLELWAKGKGLQAVTNLLQGCFSDNVDDVSLFVSTLQCFLCRQSPWTLAVCFVILPVLRQLIVAQMQEKSLKTVSDAILMIVKRFSDLILAWKTPSSKRRLKPSSSMDREQQIVCYKELHSIHQALTRHLDTHRDTIQVADILRKVHANLRPFKQEIKEN